MLDVECAGDLTQFVGQTLGTGDWVAIVQGMVEGFADATATTKIRLHEH